MARSPGGELARLFLSVPAPPEILSALADARHAFEEAGAPPLRWVRPDGIHLTLKFLGETPVSRMEEIVAAIADVTGATRPHTLRLGGFGVSNRRRPRVLWAELAGDRAETVELAARLDERLGRQGFARESRPLTPHLTLARVPEHSGDAARRTLVRLTASLGPPPPQPLPVRAVLLMRSTLGPDGARYAELARAEWRAP